MTEMYGGNTPIVPEETIEEWSKLYGLKTEPTETKMTDLEKVLLLEEILSEKQMISLRDMLSQYKEFQEELYEYPDPDTLFTKTQRELFTLLDIV